MLLILIGLIILAWLAIQTTPVQNWLVTRVTNKLSKDLHTTVRIKHVDFSLFNKMDLEGTYVQDQNKDTLLYAGKVTVNVTDWFFLKDKTELKYIGLTDAVIFLNRNDSTWNYKFLVDYLSGSKKSTSSGVIDLNLKKVKFDNVRLLQQDGWRGENMSFYFASLDVDADKVDFIKKEIRINSITVDKPRFGIYNYPGKRPGYIRPKPDTSAIINDPNHLRWNRAGWDILVNQLAINDGLFRNDKKTDRAPYNHFDGAHIQFSNIYAQFNNLAFRKDSITCTLSINTKERCGLVVKKMHADMKMHPEGMEFANLDIQTARSRLQRFFAMRYETFDDMGEFITKVRMEGDFNNAELNSDDIAYFAPELSTWKKKIRITGKVKGSVDNMVSRNVVIEAGKDTYLNGNISLKGLPDINKTYIDFEAKNFRTTYNDAITIIPALRQINQPRLDRMEHLHFTGNFLGFVKDFVTYGTVETNLGVVVTDMNMKFPDNAPAGYSGSVKTTNFKLGEFIDMPQVGLINFEGTIDGRGIQAGSLNAKLDGHVKSLDVNNYTYHDITVKGTVAKRLFNGELISNDTNLIAHLNGLVDFSQKIPAFNFDAEITKADLKKIKLFKDSINVTGKFKMNFSGNNIDNFLGTARIYEASVFKNGRRISFDSLTVESKSMDNSKIITVLSNEFDAALVGEFSIRDLPAAFSSFLNKYYPSYIKPARVPLKNENFSFVITTKKVDEYLDFVDKNLNGFNYSTVTGRINSKENLLDLNAEVPQFSYNNIFFYNVNLKGTGNLDSLSMHSSIADVYVNDSLHFPGTEIAIRSANDVSKVDIKTGSNQALNAADVSAQVQTMRSGVRIVFNESHFDLNGKNWTIEKNGELVLSKEIISADGVKIYNGQQEILVTAQPSAISNTNDIKVELTKVNIGDFAPYVVPNNRLEGLLTATADVIDPFGKMQVDLSGEAEQFRLDDDSMGRVALNANYSKRSGKVNFGAISQNKDYDFDVKGSYDLSDTLTGNALDVSGNFRETKINLLEKYLSGVFSDISGFTTGQLRVSGTGRKMKYLGRMQLRDGVFRVKYTNVLYKVPSAVIDMKDGWIDFGSFTFKDEFNNSGSVSRGVLRHEGFDNLDFDFAMNTSKLLVLATNGTGKDLFFGTVFARANATLRGPVENMRLDIHGEPADSSKVYIRPGSGRETGQADFIVWKVYGREMEAPKSSKESNLRVTLDVTANNLASMYVILDELTGDIIQANGHGNIKMQAGTDGDFFITGRYEIDRGSYNFNFQSLLRKPFKFREGAGNFIQWSGNPYDANINIEAEYVAENVRFSDLGLDQASGGALSTDHVNDNVRKFRGEVIVVATMKKALMKPEISFQIELPNNSALKNDADAQAVLMRIQRDENELNKQVAFLIVFNSFGPLSNSASQAGLANIAIGGVVVNTISGVISNQLSKTFSSAFQSIFNDKSIKVNFNAQLYNGSNILDNINGSALNFDRTNLNLNISRSLLNERLTFTFGSALDFGLSSQQVQATKNLQFLPDLTAEWKIRQDGKLVLTFFYRDSYNYLSGTGARQNRSGASISVRRDFNRLGDLFRGERKKAKPVLPDSTKTAGTN